MTPPRIGCWLELPSPEVAEIAAATGHDFVMIDMEHGTMGLETLPRMLMAFNGSGTLPVIRVPEASVARIERGLDAGAAAIMAPRIESDEQAARIVNRATCEPPVAPRAACSFRVPVSRLSSALASPTSPTSPT